jgi:hypothetical protein
MIRLLRSLFQQNIKNILMMKEIRSKLTAYTYFLLKRCERIIEFFILSYFEK